jgi:spore coat protein A, manganese oxidase
MKMSRRDILKLSFTAAAARVLAPWRALAHPDMAPAFPSPALAPFVDPLKIPPVLKPRRVGKVDTYTIVMKPGVTRCHRDLPDTNILGFNGLFPGPTIRAVKGRAVSITQQNQMPAPHHGHLPTVHLHGGLVAPEHDGHPSDTIPLNGARTYLYPNQQAACGLWYHDHTHGATGENVYRGLAGLYFIDDPREKALRLPSGRYEIPLVLQDRSFTAQGQLVYVPDAHHIENGFAGDVMLVNGVAQPYLNVSTRKYRFRILNGSNSRIYKLALSNGRPLILVGTDGGLLQRPQYLESLELAPSERADVVVDFGGLTVGTSLVLSNLNGAARTASLMQFNVAKKERDTSIVPKFLKAWNELPESAAVASRDFTLNRQLVDGQLLWVINGQPYNSANPPLAQPKLGTIERWRFINPTTHPHPMHLHLVQFQVVDINGHPQEPADFGWKDTFVVPSGSEVTFLARFAGYTGKYVFHCHNLEHEDYAMMGEFEVVP